MDKPPSGLLFTFWFKISPKTSYNYSKNILYLFGPFKSLWINHESEATNLTFDFDFLWEELQCVSSCFKRSYLAYGSQHSTVGDNIGFWCLKKDENTIFLDILMIDQIPKWCIFKVKMLHTAAAANVIAWEMWFISTLIQRWKLCRHCKSSQVLLVDNFIDRLSTLKNQ